MSRCLVPFATWLSNAVAIVAWRCATAVFYQGLVLELCEGGELYDRIQQKQYYPEVEARPLPSPKSVLNKTARVASGKSSCALPPGSCGLHPQPWDYAQAVEITLSKELL